MLLRDNAPTARHVLYGHSFQHATRALTNGLQPLGRCTKVSAVRPSQLSTEAATKLSIQQSTRAMARRLHYFTTEEQHTLVASAAAGRLPFTAASSFSSVSPCTAGRTIYVGSQPAAPCRCNLIEESARLHRWTPADGRCCCPTPAASSG